jgi:hypothetical protein
MLGNASAYLGVGFSPAMLAPLCTRDPTTHAYCMDMVIAAQMGGTVGSLDPCGFCGQWHLSGLTVFLTVRLSHLNAMAIVDFGAICAQCNTF